MNRRNFLSLATLAIAGKAAERVFPFRVYSIPKEIVVARRPINSLFDIKYSHYNADSGTYMGLSRSAYPGKLTSHIPSSSRAVLTPEILRKVEAQFLAVLGAEPKPKFYPNDYFF